MRKFDDEKGKRRSLTISNMKISEAKDYFALLFYKEPKEQQEKKAADLEMRIKDSRRKGEVKEWILAIHTNEGKLIGKMEISSSDSVTASLRIEIPNEVMSLQHGVKAIKQFRKICEENKYFTRIELVSNKITERYKEAYALESYLIEIK